jgi:hypothetical protein
MVCGDFVRPRYNNVVNKGAGGCKRCASTSTAAKLGLDPETAKARMIQRRVWPVAAFVKTLAPWLSVYMECGVFVSPSYANVVTKRQGGCVFCAAKLRTVDAAQAKQQMIERGLWPIKEFINTSDRWLCVCMTCGVFVNPRYNSVVHKGNGGC